MDLLFDKIASVHLSEKYIYILALEMVSPGSQHCANCIGTLLFLIDTASQRHTARDGSVMLRLMLTIKSAHLLTIFDGKI